MPLPAWSAPLHCDIIRRAPLAPRMVGPFFMETSISTRGKLALVLVCILSACSQAVKASSPEECLRSYVQALNSRDLKAVEALLSEDPKATWVNFGAVARPEYLERVQHWLTGKDVAHWNIEDIQLLRASALQP